MSKIFKFFENNFALISMTIITSIIFLLVLNLSGKNLIAFLLIIAFVFSYIMLFVRYKNLEKVLSKKPIEPLDYVKETGSYAIVDKHFDIQRFNNLFQKKVHIKTKELTGKNLFEALDTSPHLIKKEIETNGKFIGIIESKHMENKKYFSLSIQPSQHNNGYFVMYHNVTNTMKSDQELKEKFLIDKFTGLSTKAKLIDDIERTKKNKHYLCTLIYINIDDFDEINEYFGIDAGNKVLSYVATWLNKNLPTLKSKVYRLDLDSFAIYISDKCNITHLENYLKQISTHIEKEDFKFQGSTLNISFSIGAAQTKKDKIKSAYLALKDARSLKKSYKIHDENAHHEARFIKNIQINQTIKEAIVHNRVIPFFQPIYNLKTNKVDKFESLMRIQNSAHTYISPIDFLDVAKKSKLYLELSHEMITQSFKRMEETKFPITINISVEDILDTRVSNFILRKLNNTNLGEYITFEIVESEQVVNYRRVSNFIKKIKVHGCKVAIDDFGSGYANFEQLLKLDIDYLKIDGSLIKDIITNKESEIMLRTILSFAKEMNIKTVAEYVSNQEIFDKVKLLGVDYAQGYHIGKPSVYLGVI